jgi:hypothetical protein
MVIFSGYKCAGHFHCLLLYMVSLETQLSRARVAQAITTPLDNSIDRLIDFWCFNATFSNISAMSWRPVLVVEEAGVPGDNHRITYTVKYNEGRLTVINKVNITRR